VFAYLDSSVLLRVLFGEKTKLVEFKKIQTATSSILLRVECLRTIDRIHREKKLNEEDYIYRTELYYRFQNNIEIIPVHQEILNRASQSFSINLGTLDAIHLASALLYRERTGSDLVFLTHDKALGKAAKVLGFQVLGESS
jgi:uncharacterized protein